MPVLITRALLFDVQIRAPFFWETPMCQQVGFVLKLLEIWASYILFGSRITSATPYSCKFYCVLWKLFGGPVTQHVGGPECPELQIDPTPSLRPADLMCFMVVFATPYLVSTSTLARRL